MISVQQAIDTALQNTQRQPEQTVPLSESVGLVLAEDVAADMDMPPFDRSMMDGYALSASDARFVPATLNVIGFIPAGAYPKFNIEPGQAAKIMTGAPLPPGADAVREIEKAAANDAGTAVQIIEAVEPGQNLVPQASEMRRGEVVATSGTYVSPAVVGLLAAVGVANVRVYKPPQIAILATGDELVEPETKPLQGQIRNSNSYTIAALCSRLGLRATLLGIAKDEKTVIRNKIQAGLRADVLLITGGVSVGDLDYVGEVLEELGARILFEKVAIKPGKPTVFAQVDGKTVFGLPGNPVSGATVFEIVVRPVLRKMMGYPVYLQPAVRARLTQYFVNRSGRENYHPSVTWYEDGAFFCRPLSTKGSGDIGGYARNNSYLCCPAGVGEIPEGEEVDVILRDDFYLT